MKALRYLLIVALMSMTSVLSATNVAAQNLAQRPEVQMQSTSGMVYSGSALPQAAVEGTYVTGTTIGTYSPADASNNSGPHRAKRSLDDDDPDIPPQGQPFPIGDAAWPLMVLALAFAFGKWVAKTKPLR